MADGTLAWVPDHTDLTSAPAVALDVRALGMVVDRVPGLYLLELALDFSRGSASYALLLEVTNGN